MLQKESSFSELPGVRICHTPPMNSAAAMKYEGSAGQAGELFRQLSSQAASRYACDETMMNADRAW